MTATFASQADLDVKQVSFTRLSANAYAYTAEGDPNTGIVIGDDADMADHVLRHHRCGLGVDHHLASSPMTMPEFGSPSAV